MAGRVSVLVVVLLVLICIKFVVMLWPDTPSQAQSEHTVRALAAIGGHSTKNDNGEIVSVTLEGANDDTCMTSLQHIRGGLESLTFRGVVLDRDKTLRKMGPFPRLAELRFLNCTLNVVIPANVFPAVEWLIVADSAILDSSLIELPSCKLRVLKISGSSISAKCLQSIARNTFLRELLLARNSGLSDDGVARLGTLPELTQLYLHRSNISGSGFAGFPFDSKLEVLSVYCTDFDSTGCTYVSRFKNLRVLAAGNTQVSADGIPPLSRLKNLQLLSIPISAVTDRSFHSLEAMPSLKTLELVFDTPETRAPSIQRLNADWFRNWDREIIGNALVITRGDGGGR